MTPALNDTPLQLHAADTPAWQMWSQLVELSRHLQPDDWLLVGGQMRHWSGSSTRSRCWNGLCSAEPRSGRCCPMPGPDVLRSRLPIAALDAGALRPARNQRSHA